MVERTGWRQQLPLWIILGVTAVVLAAGFLLLPRNETDKARLLGVLGTSNHGRLLSPVAAMADLPLTSLAGAPEDWPALPPRWRVVVAAAQGMAAGCRDALYLTRQVHVRLGRNADRIERVLLIVGDAPDAQTADYLADEHPQLRVLWVAPERFTRWSAADRMGWAATEPRVFVVDPQGAAMLYFTPEQSGADLLQDLNHLLKYSPEP